MKGLTPLFLGIFGTFLFSWTGLILIPNYQIGHLDPQTDEEGNDAYPMPRSGMAERGRQIYAANGCVYCHSQQIRSDFASTDLERNRDVPSEDKDKPKWGERRSAPRDYLFDRPVLLGKMRMGPDLANMGKSVPAEPESAPAAGGTPAAAAAGTPQASVAPGGTPSALAATSPAAASPAPASVAPPSDIPPKYGAAWHHRHLYSPRSVVLDSNMPAYHFLYEKRRISGEKAADALKLVAGDAASDGWEVVPTYDARCLVAYLMSLDQSHALKEVKGGGGPPAPAPAAAPPKEGK